MNGLEKPASLILSANEEACDVELEQGRVSARTFRSPDKLTDNEDAALVVVTADGSLLLAVADGVGGSPGGREAASTVVNSLGEYVIDGAGGADHMGPQILDAIETANRTLLAQGRGSATTIVVAEITAGSLRAYHAGDSEIMVTGQRGKDKLRVVPHSPTGFAVQAGLLDEKAAIRHEARHLLLNVVGATDMRVEVSAPIRLGARDTVILATDGILDNLYPDEIIEIIRCGALVEAADELAARAGKRMLDFGTNRPSKPDDMTFVLFRPAVSSLTVKA